MKREDGRKLFRAFLGNSRETAGEQRAMMEQMAVPSRERSLYSMVEHLLSLDETAWYLYAWSRDPLEGRFSREQKLAYGFRAAECGRSEAQLILGKTDVWDIAAGMGLKVLTPQVPVGGWPVSGTGFHYHFHGRRRAGAEADSGRKAGGASGQQGSGGRAAGP